MSQKFEASKINGPHQQLTKLIGDWEGISRVWFEPGDPVDESPIKGTISSILGDRFVKHEYQSAMQAKPLEGLMIIGYHLALEKYQCSWIDSFHNGTAMMFCDGKRKDQQMAFTGNYTYVTPDKEHVWFWRTEIEMKDEDTLIFTAYNISPDGDEQKATEISYKRIK